MTLNGRPLQTLGQVIELKMNFSKEIKRTMNTLNDEQRETVITMKTKWIWTRFVNDFSIITKLFKNYQMIRI